MTSVYLLGVQGGIVVGSIIGGAIAGAWGVIAPFWFGFAGSALLVALIWRQLTLIVHADEAHLKETAKDPDSAPWDTASST